MARSCRSERSAPTVATAGKPDMTLTGQFARDLDYVCGLERFIGFVKAGKLRDDIFDEEFDAVAEAKMGGVKDVVGARPHFADQALANRAARASRPCGIDPLRKSRSCRSPGRKRKPDLLQ